MKRPDMDRSITTRAMASAPRLKILRLLAEPQKHFGDQWSADPAEFGVCMTLIAEVWRSPSPRPAGIDILRQGGFITVQKTPEMVLLPAR